MLARLILQWLLGCKRCWKRRHGVVCVHVCWVGKFVGLLLLVLVCILQRLIGVVMVTRLARLNLLDGNRCFVSHLCSTANRAATDGARVRAWLSVCG